MKVRDEFFPDFNKNKFLENYSINKTSSLETGLIQYNLNEDNELIFTGFNSLCSSILGVDCNQFIGKSIVEAFPSLRGTKLLEKYRQVAITGESWETEHVEYSDDNLKGIYNIDVHQVEPGKVLVHFQDVTKQKIDEKIKNNYLEFLNSIYINVSQIIFVVEVYNEKFTFSEVNPTFEKMTGILRKDVLDRSPEDLLDFMSADSVKNVILNYNKCVKTKKSIRYEEMIPFEGRDRWWLTTLNPVIDENENVKSIIGTSFEITERKTIEQKLIENDSNLETLIEEQTSELRESELRFRKMAEGLYDGIRIFDNSELVYVNSTFCEISGYTLEELKYMDVTELVHIDDKNRVKNHIDNSRNPKVTPGDIKYTIISKDGRQVRIKNRYVSFEKDNGERILYVLSRDITEIEENEKQLLLQSKALNVAANGISITDKSGKIIWVNDALIELSGYDREELIGNYPSIHKSGKHNKEFYDNLWKTILEGSVWRGEFVNKRKNDDIYYDETTITPLKKNGEISHFIEIKQDISNRKKVEADLKNSEEYYRSIFESSHISIIVSDVEGKILEMNNSAKQLFGINGENINKLNYRQFLENEEIFTNFINTIKQDGSVNDFPTRIKNKTNSKLDCLVNATLHKSKNETLDVFQAIIIDISDIVKAKQLLENALVEAEKANKLKSEFLATMSHEIRTPINIILSYLGLIKSDIIDQVDKDLQELFPSMERAGKRIIRTIDLLLNVAELNSGTYESKFQNINLYESILERVYLDYRNEAHAKGLEFNLIKLSDNFDVIIDEYTVIEVFKNLIDNAIKYTHNGKVDIKIRKNLMGSVEVEIIDTGIGIDEKYLPYLFEPFTQEETGYTRKFEGNGLGMALVKQYVNLNKASIQVSSTKGKGTNFTVTFQNRM